MYFYTSISPREKKRMEDSTLKVSMERLFTPNRRTKVQISIATIVLLIDITCKNIKIRTLSHNTIKGLKLKKGGH